MVWIHTPWSGNRVGSPRFVGRGRNPPPRLTGRFYDRQIACHVIQVVGPGNRMVQMQSAASSTRLAW